MDSEIEDQLLVVQPEDDQVALKKPMRSYTRDFLLSLSDLEVCKKLPDGFDESLLSEFEESSHGMYDRPRVGGSSVQGSRRSDYGSSAPGRSDSGSLSRGLQRWDSRSSGKSDTDTDSESGKRYGSQTQKSVQNSEHDGLLGSGSFPRSSGFAAGAAIPRYRPNSSIHLNKSNEPYHPPRPFKATPHTRRETKDSFNDETFGSADSTTEDRVEEEKKRRAEFELMRKEQHKALQEKQKSNSGKLDDPFSEITGVPGNPSDTASKADESSKEAVQDDVSKHRVTSRPLVPPGFVNSVDKSPTSKSNVDSDQVEVGESELKESHRNVGSVAKDRGLSDISGLSALMSQKTPILQGADQAKISDISDVTSIFENGDISGFDSTIAGPQLLGDPHRSTSILDKLFGNATTRDGSSTSNLVEDHGAKADGIWSPTSLQSKFASWFTEEDMNQSITYSDTHANNKRVEDNISPRKPNDLLSLIVGGEKAGSDISDETRLAHVTTFNTAPSTAEIPVQISSNKAVKTKPAVLTCEDLEQSILLGIGGNDSNSQLNGKDNHVFGVKTEHPSDASDNQASQHLLSLLQRGTESKNMTLFSEKESPHETCAQGVQNMNITDKIGSGDVERSNSCGKTLTLEALFGTAFMKELHSAQRSSVGSAGIDVPDPTGLSFLTSDSAPFPLSMNEGVNGSSGNDGSNAVFNEGVGKLHQSGYLSGYHDPGKDIVFSKPPTEIDSNFGRFEGGVGVRLLEQDGLNNSVMMPNPDSVGADLLTSSSNEPVNFIDKLATLGVAVNGERSMTGRQDPMMSSGPHDMVKPELPYQQNLHRLASSPLFHATQQMNHSKPLYPPLDPHMKFIHQDVAMHFQFPGNTGQPPLHHHSGGGLPGFDHHPVPHILPQMHIAGNLPPSRLERGFSTGTPMPSHPDHNASGYVYERNPVQGFPFGGQRQLNFATPGIGPPGSETSNPPEAFQRLMEMELRANPKQMLPPFAGGGPRRPMYGHELDMGFRYR